MKIIFLDSETTGLLKPLGTALPYQPHMIEFYGILISKNKIISEFETLIKPPIPIPFHISKITNINDEMVKNSPSIHEVIKPIKKIIEKADIMVAQNLRFDMDVIKYEAKRCRVEIKFPPILYCTVEQSMHFKGFRLKSSELFELATDKEIKGIHRASSDVKAMRTYKKHIEKKLPFNFQEVK